MTESVPPATRRRHWEMLVIASLTVLLACLLQVRDDGRVAVSGLSGLPLPPLCLSYAWFGVKCPGCGLTRSIIYLAHGDWEASWRLHRLGAVLAIAIVMQLPYRIVALWRGGRPPLGTVVPTLFGRVLIVLLLGNWLLDLLFQPAALRAGLQLILG